MFDKQGNLYGVTSDGAESINSRRQRSRAALGPSRLFTYSKGNSDGDGATPSGGLVIDGSGKLYGVTAHGGTGNCVLLGILVGVARCTIFSAIAKGRSVERDHPV